MTHKHMLVGTSLFTTTLLSLHLAQDALRARPGTTEAGAGNIVGILLLLVMLAGPALLAERRSGQLLMLLGALGAVGMPALHFNLGSDMHKHGAPLVFVWSLLLLGVAGLLSMLLLTSELPRVWRATRASAPDRER